MLIVGPVNQVTFLMLTTFRPRFFCGEYYWLIRYKSWLGATRDHLTVLIHRQPFVRFLDMVPTMLIDLFRSPEDEPILQITHLFMPAFRIGRSAGTQEEQQRYQVSHGYRVVQVKV